MPDAPPEPKILKVGAYLPLILIVIYSAIFDQAYIYSVPILAIGIALAVLSITAAAVYLLYKGRRRKVVSLSILAVFIALFATASVVAYPMRFSIVGYLFNSVFSYGTYIFQSIMFTSFIFLGIYLARQLSGSRFRYPIAAALIIGILAVSLTVNSLYGIQVPNDEEWLAVNSLHLMLSGQNPYQVNFFVPEANALRNGTVFGVTYATNNELMSVLNHPVLYPLSYLPVSLIWGFSTHSLLHFDLIVSGSIYVVLLFVVLALLSDTRKLSRPDYAVIAFMALLMYINASAVGFLMMAVLLVTYVKMHSRYLFVLLGIAMSIQELLWVPVLLFLVYRFNNEGIRSGMATLAGALIVFLLINGYFIALSPSSFFSGVVSTLGTGVHMIPISSGPFYALLLQFYQLPLGSANLLFYAGTAVAVVLMAYFNDRRLIGILCLIPFFSIYLSINAYYVFFIAFFALSVYVRPRPERTHGRTLLERLSIGRISPAMLSVLSVISILAVASTLVYAGHLSYVSNFRVGISNPSVVHGLHNSTYSARLSYDLSNKTNVTFIMYAMGAKPEVYGLMNTGALATYSMRSGNGSYSLVDSNILDLQGSGRKTLKLIINNSTVEYMACTIYSEGYYYICPVAMAG